MSNNATFNMKKTESRFVVHNEPLHDPKKVVSSFSTAWLTATCLRLASTRAEFEQTATGLLTKLEKGLQSAQEAPIDGRNVKRMNCNFAKGKTTSEVVFVNEHTFISLVHFSLLLTLLSFFFFYV